MNGNRAAFATAPLPSPSPSGLDREPLRTVDRDGSRASLFALGEERIFTVEPRQRAAVANLIFVHGLTDHAARHLHAARWLAGRGYRTVLFDLAGHGGRASEWRESWPVLEAYATSEEAGDILEAIRRQVPPQRAQDLIRRQYAALERTHFRDHLMQLDGLLELLSETSWFSGLPLFLIGHSMGALAAIEATWRWRWQKAAALSGLVLLSPALKPTGRPGNYLEQRLVDAVWALRRAPVSFLRSGLKGALELNLPVPTAWGNRWISDLPAEVELLFTDPLKPPRLPTRYGSSIESQMAATERRGARLPNDALVLLPGRDGVTSRQAGLRFAEAVRAAEGADRLRLVRFDGIVAHDLLRSSVRQEALEAVGGWLDERLG